MTGITCILQYEKMQLIPCTFSMNDSILFQNLIILFCINCLIYIVHNYIVSIYYIIMVSKHYS